MSSWSMTFWPFPLNQQDKLPPSSMLHLWDFTVLGGTWKVMSRPPSLLTVTLRIRTHWETLLTQHYPKWSMLQRWGRGWWGRWCRAPDLPWSRHLDMHRGFPPTSAGAPGPSWASGRGWMKRTDLDYSGNGLRSRAAPHPLWYREEKDE